MADRLEIKAAFEVDEEGTITGLASVFGTADLGGDVVHKGAFADARAPLPMLASHDQADVVGVWEELRETPEGLAVKGRLLVADVVRAAEVRALVKAGAMTGLSIGYRATKKAPRTGGGRDLFKVELLEVSVVAVPMHPAARVQDVKALEGGGKVETMEPAELEQKMAGAVTAALAPLVERLGKLEAKGNRPEPKAGGGDDLTTERKAFRSYISFGDRAPAEELKALSVSSDPMGGYLAPAEVSTEILRDLVEFSPIRSVASVRSTGAPSVIYPKRSPFGNATWDDMETDETTATPDTKFMGQTEVVLKGIGTYFDVSSQLLQDAPAAEAEARAGITEDFAKKEAAAFVRGDGIKQPEGIMTHSEIVSVNMGSTSAILPDRLIQFLYAIPATYRNAGTWAMNGTTLGLMMTLKDGQGNYLWRPGLSPGQPDTILGRPVLEVLDMDNVESGKEPILYGAFDGYRILDRSSLSWLVDPYTRATQKQTRFHCYRRVGGRVVMPAKFRKLKMAV